MDQDTADAQRLRRELAAHRNGVLLYDQTPLPIQFVTDGATGSLVFAVPRDVLTADEYILFVPEEAAEALQLLVHLEQIDSETEACDRWRAYHGDCRHPHWAKFEIDSGKFEGCLSEGDQLMIPNSLGRGEWSICKSANARKEDLIAFVRDYARIEPKDPLVVGVDQFGMDVRVRFGIVRVEFDLMAQSVDDAAAMVDQLLGGSESDR